MRIVATILSCLAILLFGLFAYIALFFEAYPGVVLFSALLVPCLLALVGLRRNSGRILIDVGFVANGLLVVLILIVVVSQRAWTRMDELVSLPFVLALLPPVINIYALVRNHKTSRPINEK